MTPMLPELYIRFHHNQTSLPTVEYQIGQLWPFVSALSKLSPLWESWLLKGDTKENALLYDAFDGDGPTKSALAVLNTQYKGVTDVRTIGFWNGKEKGEGASIVAFESAPGNTSDWIRLSWAIEPQLTWQQISDLMILAASIWSPSVIYFGPKWYDEHKVFKDRPGVGWMLYLPRKLTADQVPEARALVPIMDGKKQTGTIIVSQTDETFDAANPEHVAVANAIEVRLVDQDLLPLYTEL